MKIQSTLTAAVLTGAALLAAACAPPNPQLQAPYEAHGSKSQSVPVASRTEFSPKVDVLFVIDNSMSMKDHQENLKRNIDRFVEAFEANKHLDFHIGVTTVWDSRRFDGVTVTADKFHPLGLLYPVQNGLAPAALVAGQPALLAANFVNRIPGYTQILGETLKIGVVPRGTDKVDLGGPENEELFTPVIAAIDGRNVGFIRHDAHLAVIMITDADDVSSISPSKLQDALASAKEHDSSMFSTYAVLSLSKSCPKDPGNKKDSNRQILDFLSKTDGKAFDLCDSHYGDKLAEAGRMIEKRASREVKIYLESVPQAGTLKVVFAGTNTEVPHTYNPRRHVITVLASSMEGQPADAQIEVDYTPVDVNSLNTPKTKTVVAPF